MTELDQVAAATRERDAIQDNWVASLRAAVAAGATFGQVAAAAGVTRQRVSQIVGPTGRKPGRRKPEADTDAMEARLAELDQRWDRFIDALAERYAHPDPKGEQAYRNRTNHRIKLAQSGKTRAGKNSGACSPFARMRVMPTVRDETRRFAETFALRYLEEHGAHLVCVQVIGELDEAAGLREQLTAMADARAGFAHV